MAKRYQTIFDKNQMYLQDMQGKSLRWFYSQVDALGTQRITPTKLINDNLNKEVSHFRPGELYFYNYDPKHKETLPYYDRFPLVFPFRIVPTGFYGLNMHYLPYDGRIMLLEALTEFQTKKGLDERTRLKLSWKTIEAMSKFPLAKPCVKQYLFSHIKSKVVKIDSYHWATAMMMPVQRFVKQTETYVWMNSMSR
jgi:hypothetical protein